MGRAAAKVVRRLRHVGVAAALKGWRDAIARRAVMRRACVRVIAHLMDRYVPSGAV